jgi:transposase
VEVEQMVTETADYVIGVDTHAGSHTLALVEASSGVLVGQFELPASRAGYRQALTLARRSARGSRLWAIEGSGCYGAGLCRFLARKQERLLEVDRPRRSGRQRRLKSDALDALRAARAALAGEKLATPRAAGDREALRVLVTTREGAVAVGRDGLNELRALIVTAPAHLRERLAGLPRGRLLKACCELRPRPGTDTQLRATQLALRACARRAAAASTEANELKHEIDTLVQTICPQLLAQPGVGPISAAFVLIAWSHSGRFHSEAGFARLAGSAPIPASSGKLVRHRLDRGGDRKLNRALHTIILSRRRTDTETQTYIARRLSEGKSEREAIRCLKRYLARSLYRLLERSATTA